MSKLGIRTSLLAHNILLNMIGQGFPLIVAILSIPFVIRGLGIERFGILTFAWILLGYFNIFDLGFGRATTKFVAEALSIGKKERLPSIVWTSIINQTTLGVIGGFIMVIITPLLVNRVIHIPINLRHEASETLYILSISMPAILITTSLRGVLEASQRFDLVNLIRLPLSSLNFLLPLLGVYLNLNLPEIMISLVLSWWLALIVYFWFCFLTQPPLKKGPFFDWIEFRSLLNYGGWITVSSVMGPILIYLDRLVIGILMTITSLAYFSTPYEMVTRLLFIPVGVVATLFPAFSMLEGGKQRERIEILMSISLKYILITVGPLIIFISVNANSLLSLWLGSEFAKESTLTLQILSIGILINSFAHVPFSLIQALNRPDLTAKFHLFELSVHIFVVWSLVTLFGITGAALAWTIRVTIDAVLLFGTANRFLPGFFNALQAKKVFHVFIFLGVSGIGVLLSSLLFSIVWVYLCSLVVIFITMGWVVWHYFMDEREHYHILKLLRIAETEQ